MVFWGKQKNNYSVGPGRNLPHKDNIKLTSYLNIKRLRNSINITEFELVKIKLKKTNINLL